ncbi:MAG: extracellular solute-binding protein [Bacillota bacterium]
MKKWTLFSLLTTLTFLIVSCSNSTAPIPYDKKGLPNLKGHHLVAYVATSEEVGDALLSSFCEQRECTYEFLRLSAEEIVRRVTEERHAPRADVVIGGTLDAHVVMKSRQLSTPISTEHKDSLPKELYDSENYWFGFEIIQLAIAVNTELWQKVMNDAPIPPSLSLQDLTDERFKGKIVMSDPNFSGTAFTLFSSIAQTMSKIDAQTFVKQLSENTGAVTVNGFMPIQMVGSGEYMLSFNFLGSSPPGLPIKTIQLKGKALSTISGISKLKNAPNGQVVDLFIDYCLSDEAGIIMRRVSGGTPIAKESLGEPLVDSALPLQQSVQHTKELIEYWNKLRLSQ